MRTAEEIRKMRKKGELRLAVIMKKLEQEKNKEEAIELTLKGAMIVGGLGALLWALGGRGKWPEV